MDNSRFSRPMEKVYEGVVDALLSNLAKHFNVKATGNSGSFEWEVQKLAELGALTQESVGIIAERVAQNEPMIRLALEGAILEALEEVEPELAAATREGLLAGGSTASVLPMAETVERVLTAYSHQALNQCNLVNTVMLDSTLAAYRKTVSNMGLLLRQIDDAQEILNLETGKVLTGASSRQDAVRSAVKQMAQEGLTGFVDHGGHHWSPEAYVNMDIRTTTGNAVRQAVFERNEAYGNHFISVRYKRDARPKCFPYQGRVFSTDGSRGTVCDLYDNEISYIPLSETTYGQPDGLFGINCGHLPQEVFVPGHTLLLGAEDADSAEDNAQRYAQSQRQRRLECRVRAAKREAITLEAAGDKEGFDAAALRVRRAQGDLRAFEKETGRTHYGDRSQVFGYNRSIAGQATAAAKKHFTHNANGQPVTITKKTLRQGEPNAITQVVGSRGGITRNYYGADGRQIKQLSNNDHGNGKWHSRGLNGEHAHDYQWDENGDCIRGEDRDLTDAEREENGDIL